MTWYQTVFLTRPALRAASDMLRSWRDPSTVVWKRKFVWAARAGIFEAG